MSLDLILSKFHNVKSQDNGWYNARCPAHDDRQNSLGIGEDDEGKVIFKCHAGDGCSRKAIIEAAGLTPDQLNGNGSGNGHKTQRRIAETYDYKDADGKLLYQSVRYEPKGFSQRQPDGRGGWIWSVTKPPVKRVLYNLKAILDASPLEPVFICEGEKDASRLINLGLTATTNVMGAGKWRLEYNEPLKGRNVVILPDNDKAGNEHAQTVAHNLVKVAASVRIIEAFLPNVPKSDVCDWLNSGHSKEELLQLIIDTPEFQTSVSISGSPEAFLLDEGIDDEGNAHCLVAMFPGKFTYCPAYGYMFYNGKHWQADAELILDRHIVEMLKARRIAAVKELNEPLVKFSKPNSGRVRGCKDLLKSLISTETAKFDSSMELLNCANGVVDLRTGQLHPHNPAQFFTYCLPVEYDPKVDTSVWQKWILETVGSEAVANYLKLAVGYTLTGYTSEECLFYIQGPTRSGKGTFTETLLALLGKPLSTEVDFMTFTSKRDADANNFDLAPLKATRFVAASESTDYDFLNDRRIKTLTGGNHISCAFKHKDFFTYRPQFKVWLSSNKPIRANAGDDAIWVRVKVIRFPNSHAGKEDKSLKQRFLSSGNLKAVLAWAIQGSIEWFKLPSGLKTPPEVARETQKQREGNDYVAQFLEECTEERNGVFTPNDVIRPVYRAWCEANSLKPKERELALRLTTGFLAGRGYLSQSELDQTGYSRLIKLPDGVTTTNQLRGYYGVVIPEYVLSEYLL